MKHPRILPPLALALGVVGSTLRRVQLAVGFEADTGLALQGSWINLLMPLFLGAVILALILLALPLRGRRLAFDRCFRAPEGAALPLAAAGALLFFLSGGLYLAQYLRGGAPALDLVAGAFSLFLGLSLLYVLRRWRQEGTVEGVFLLPGVVFFLLQLLAAYLAHGTFPVLERYGVEILALAALVYGFYQLAAAGYRQGGRRALVRGLGLGVALPLVAAASLTTPSESLSLAAGAAVLLAFALSLREGGQEPEEEEADGNEADGEAGEPDGGADGAAP